MSPDQTKPGVPPEALVYERARAAFYRDLPELLQKRSGQWVAYQDENCIGFAGTQTELFRRCLQRGLKEEDFILRFVSTAALADHEEVDLPCDP